ncbi:MAG: ATP/GTP-binding protein [Cryobacterium sp.]|nr:ATP/GTP-binding protein [Cryobacterium sp.]
MTKKQVLEQHIALFGESGSGKTVMLSSFFGDAQEPKTIKRTGLNVIAENPSQGTLLSQAFLGMKRSATPPLPTRFTSTAYSFKITVKNAGAQKAKSSAGFDALRLVWHDYPGEWFEQEPSGAKESQHRVETFRALLESDVALLLVDGQKLLDHVGEEERYLKSLLTNVRNSLLLLKDEIIADGDLLTAFPRIWLIGLSKSDLIPALAVQDFRELLLEKVGADIVELRDTIAGFIDGDDALSVGEDFVILSSAKFGEGAIDVFQRVGLDLVLPIASVLPFERHVRWANSLELPAKVAAELLKNAKFVAAVLGLVGKFAAFLIGKKFKMAGGIVYWLADVSPEAIEKAAVKAETFKETVAEKGKSISSVLLSFNEDLERAEREGVLSRSRQ